MIWVLAVLLSVRRAKTCEVNSQEKKLLKPSDSITNGANFLSHSKKVDTHKLCHKGCCTVTQCDTSFYTGSKFDKKGNNCFYFKCDGNCIFENATQAGAGNFSIAHVTHGLNTSELPVDMQSENNKVVVADDDKRTNNTMKDESEDSRKTNATASGPRNDNDLISQNKLNHYSISNSSLEVADTANYTAPVEDNIGTDKSADTEKFADNDKSADTEKFADTTKNVDSAKSLSVDADHQNDESEKIALDSKSNSPPIKTEIDLENYDKKPVTQPPAESNKTVRLDSTVNANIGNGEQNVDLKVKIDILESSENRKYIVKDVVKAKNSENRKYTVKDVVFWISVVGGAGLIFFGLAMIVRVYRNKRRRLYSSLTDDYLINGMYSI